MDRSDENPPDNDHGYTAEQKAMDGGLMDQFVQATGNGNDTVMDYYDGNTVTAMWNYAQHFSLNDNSFGTNFGPSSPGAINLISGSTHGDGAIAYSGNVDDPSAKPVATISGALDQNQTLYSDKDPYFDKDSTGTTVEMTGNNIGDLLNAKNITWGWFEGGFRTNSEKHTAVNGATSTDYVPHHEPFQFYKSTANPEHLPPSSPSMIGKTDQANHQYDLTDFWTAADSGNLPAVSFLKAPAYEDAHPGNSDPLDEQTFVTNTINQLEQLPTWSSTAVIINYDDSDGWYDHVMPPIITQSDDPNADVLVGDPGKSSPHALNYPDKLGYGPRLPLLVISPYARQNFVDNTMTDQSSILKFIEDNWNLGTIGNESSDAFAGTLDNMFDFSHPTDGKLFLNPSTGEPESQGAAKQQFDSYVAKVYSDAGVTQPNTPTVPVPSKTPAPGKLGKILG
ncbi:phospholipase C [Alicyclobacillus fastidiosus]|uniref:phospholipase C n=1 Tax=Alicyclobacillus fastidiosus TaxID=392011 RepID=UPI0024E0F3E2|nr:alkaline phosphatase family protein [Alicyclobacillus fastidiosus]